MTEATPEQVGPWTVKGVPAEDRAEINAAAKRAGMNVGEWLRSAALLKIHTERQGPNGTVPAAEDHGRPEAYHPPAAASLAVVTQLAAVLPGLTETKGGGRLAARARRVIDQHLSRLLLEAESPPASPPRIAPPER